MEFTLADLVAPEYSSASPDRYTSKSCTAAMPSVFFSYSRSDLATVQQLEQSLVAAGIVVWRDQDKIYGGQKWPKALGEAIAAQDYFLLAWSKQAADSHYVELEWNTAIALKKPIIPYLLDRTPLPSLLQAIQGIDARDPTNAISQILAALKTEAPIVDAAHRAEVIKQLGGIPATKPEHVLREAKAIFIQRQWTVQGNVYQAAGDIYITIGETSAKSGHENSVRKSEKSLLEKWQAWAALILAILTIIGLALDLPGKIGSLFYGTDEVLDQPLAGWIRDMETDLPLEGVDVTLQHGGIT